MLMLCLEKFPTLMVNRVEMSRSEHVVLVIGYGKGDSCLPRGRKKKYFRFQEF